MDLSLPEFPTDLIGRAIFVSTLLLALLSLLPLVIPHVCKRYWGLVEKNTRPGSLGELRVASAFVIGLCVASLLFDQPFIVLALGMALGFAAFGRILSLLSDQASTVLNFAILLIQILFSGVMLTTFFDVWSPESTVAMPEDLTQQIVFSIYCLLMVLGALILFAPRVSMTSVGLALAENRQGGEAVFRSAGGFLFGLGLAGVLMVNPMLDLAIGAAFVFSCFGRLTAMVFDRGNMTFNLVSLVIQALSGGLILATIFGYL